MALISDHLQRFLLISKLHTSKNSSTNLKHVSASSVRTGTSTAGKNKCSAIAIDASSSLAGVGGLRLGSTGLQGPRDEMEDDVVVRSDVFGDGSFSFAAVFDGHGGFSSVKFLRDELCKECVAALQGGALLRGADFDAVTKALKEAFENVDAKLSNWLEAKGTEDESGSTATLMFIGNDTLVISHIGDSSVVLSRSGKVEVLTEPHRPYGSSKASLQEIRRIREAGGWIVNGRICGDIAVSRAFGDIRFKAKKNEMLQKGVEGGRWSEKFSSRVQFNGDLVTATPDVFKVTLGPDVEFILLASDGLWDYMNSSEAVALIRNRLKKHEDVQLASEELAQAVLDRRSEDNISIVLADLGCTDWRNVQVQQANVVLELGQAFATVGIVSLAIWMSSMISP